MRKNKQDIYNADHPNRKKAIQILEKIEETTNKNIPKKYWYELEDYITLLITK